MRPGPPPACRPWISAYTRWWMAKILVSVDDKLLARIDRAARSAGVSRSAYLARLAQRDLGEARGPGTSEKARQAVRRLQGLFDAHRGEEDEGDPTAAIRRDRDAR